MHCSVRSGKSSFYRRHREQTRLCKQCLSLFDSQCWSTWGARKFFILPWLWPAPKHSSHLVRRWCLYSWLKVIKTAPQLPDLNVIENLWAKLRTEIRNNSISNKEDLNKVLREEWKRINSECTKKLAESIPVHLKEVTIKRGLQTQYWKSLEVREISFYL